MKTAILLFQFSTLLFLYLLQTGDRADTRVKEHWVVDTLYIYKIQPQAKSMDSSLLEDVRSVIMKLKKENHK